jgi:hypothetical protein
VANGCAIIEEGKGGGKPVLGHKDILTEDSMRNALKFVMGESDQPEKHLVLSPNGMETVPYRRQNDF